MVAEFPTDDEIAWKGMMWSHFMFGESIMVVPVLEADAKTLDVYFPKGTWYKYFS